MTARPSRLFLFGEHHYGGTLLLPDHPPEVVGGVREGPLSGDVSVAVVVTLRGRMVRDEGFITK